MTEKQRTFHFFFEALRALPLHSVCTKVSISRNNTAAASTSKERWWKTVSIFTHLLFHTSKVSSIFQNNWEKNVNVFADIRWRIDIRRCCTAAKDGRHLSHDWSASEHKQRTDRLRWQSESNESIVTSGAFTSARCTSAALRIHTSSSNTGETFRRLYVSSSWMSWIEFRCVSIKEEKRDECYMAMGEEESICKF